MKKIKLIMVYCLAGTALPALAATGSANDGFWLVLFFVALLLLIAGIWSMIDFFRHLPKSILTFPKRILHAVVVWFSRHFKAHHPYSLPGD